MMRPDELFRFCPRCGAPRPVGNVGRSPLRCDACDLVLYFNPAVAAAALVADPSGRILFIRRAKDPSAGKLGVPGGFIDFDESAEDGLRREVREEVGLEIDRLAFLMSFPNTYPYLGVTYPVVDLYFTAETADPSAARPLDAVLAVEWRYPHEVPDEQIAFPSMQVALATLRSRTRPGGGTGA